MKKLIALLAIVALFGFATVAQAYYDNVWIGPVDGSWMAGTNWSTGNRPNKNDGDVDIVFTGSAPISVDCDAALANPPPNGDTSIHSITTTNGCADVNLFNTVGGWKGIGFCEADGYVTVTDPATTLTVGGGMMWNTSNLDWSKKGDGVLNFTGDYNGGGYGLNTIVAGTLLCNGNGQPQSYANMTVNTGATLGGAGTVGGAGTDGRNDIVIESGGKLSPGAVATVGTAGTLTMELNNSPGLDISGAVTGDSASMLFDLAAPGTSDMVAFSTGLLTIGSGLLDLNDFVFSGSPEAGTYTLFDGYQTISGSLGATTNGTVLGCAATLTLTNSSQDIVLILTGGAGGGTVYIMH
jgi:hypothetical protein